MPRLATALPQGERMPDRPQKPMVLPPLLVLLLEKGVHAHARHLMRQVGDGLHLHTTRHAILCLTVTCQAHVTVPTACIGELLRKLFQCGLLNGVYLLLLSNGPAAAIHDVDNVRAQAPDIALARKPLAVHLLQCRNFRQLSRDL